MAREASRWIGPERRRRLGPFAAALALFSVALPGDLGLAAAGLPVVTPWDAAVLSAVWLIAGLAGAGPLRRAGLVDGHAVLIAFLAAVGPLALLTAGAEHALTPDGIDAARAHLVLSRHIAYSPVFAGALFWIGR